jgi:hypothetical protein
MQTTFRVIASAAGLLALALQFLLEVQLPRGPGLFGSTVNFFSYFTVLANCAAALAMLVPVIGGDSRLGRFFSIPSVRTAIAGYLIVVGGTYFLFLRHVGDDQGLERVADQLMHYVTPILFMVDWLAFVPKGHVPWTIIGTSLIPLIVYGIWTIVHGSLGGWYPYPFVNIKSLGYQLGLENMANVLVVFVTVALILVVIDRLIGSVQLGRQHRTHNKRVAQLRTAYGTAQISLVHWKPVVRSII